MIYNVSLYTLCRCLLFFSASCRKRTQPEWHSVESAYLPKADDPAKLLLLNKRQSIT